MTPAQRARLDIREKRHTGTTRGLAPGADLEPAVRRHGSCTAYLEADKFCIP